MTGQNSPFDVFRPLGRLTIPEALADVPDAEPMLSVLGSIRGFDRLPERKALKALALREISQSQLEVVAGMPWLETLVVFGFRGTSLASLAAIGRLRAFSLGWAPKLLSLDDFGALTRLDALGLSDIGKVDDLAPLSRLAGLRGLAISGSFTKPQRVRTLEPIRQLDRLTDLSLDGLRVDNDDLRPVASMRHLTRLQLGRGFPVREYARLSVALRHLECEAFAPTSHMEHKTWDPSQNLFVTDTALGETILIARPIKMVRAADPKGAALIAKRIAEHERWQAHYRAVPDPAADDLMELPALPKPKSSARRARRT